MPKRTTIEIDEQLLARAKRALGVGTTRATVEEALRLAAEAAEEQGAERAAGQVTYLDQLRHRIDVQVLESGEMWR